MWQGGRAVGQNNKIFLHRICMKSEFSSQWRETVLFSSTSTATVTSAENQQYAIAEDELRWASNPNREVPVTQVIHST